MKCIAQLKIHTKPEILQECTQEEKEDIDVLKILEEKQTNQIEKIEKLLNYRYPYEASTKIPTKTSVTKIKQAEQEKLEISFPIPKFMQKEEDIKLTGAQKGTLIHLCMQKLVIGKKYDANGIQELIKGLQEKEIITEKEAQNINIQAVLMFTKTKIWEEMQQAKEVQREKPFYVTIPASEIYGEGNEENNIENNEVSSGAGNEKRNEDIKENVLVQGIIDLYYLNKNGELILVDYKTDFVQTAEELIEKYKTQLDLYKRALEESMGQKVKNIYIYSTFLGKEIEIC